MTACSLTDASVFYDAFLAAYRAEQSPWPRLKGQNKGWTDWFGALMQRVAASGGLYCASKNAPIPGELMCVDHVMIRKRGYDSFPLIAIEHESRGLGTTDGSLPTWDCRADIEWAFWKSLTMRSFLSVLAAYPWEKDRQHVLSVFGKMATAWAEQFGSPPNCLCLLGWWTTPPYRPVDAASLFEPYVAVVRDGEVIFEKLA